MILAGDIGGTKTSLALFERFDGVLKAIAQGQFASAAFPTFNDVLKEFSKTASLADIDGACFGVAGPVVNGNCRTTNLPWELNSLELQERLQTKNVYVLNDLEATAYGMLYLDEEEFVELNPTGRSVNANRAVIAAGTGLGEAMLFYDGEQWHPSGSEGGHCDFAPITSQQDELLSWLRNRHASHVSLERVLSGPGVYALYEFLKERDFAPEPEAIKNAPLGSDKSALVSECALNKDPLCVEALRLFVQIYGAEAGNLALKTLSLGGVYIGGGIAPKILPFMLDGVFMDAFSSKGRFEELLRGMKVKVSLNQETALLGAAHFILDKVKL